VSLIDLNFELSGSAAARFAASSLAGPGSEERDLERFQEIYHHCGLPKVLHWSNQRAIARSKLVPPA
jgi:hypothetical protein